MQGDQTLWHLLGGYEQYVGIDALIFKYALSYVSNFVCKVRHLQRLAICCGLFVLLCALYKVCIIIPSARAYKGHRGYYAYDKAGLALLFGLLVLAVIVYIVHIVGRFLRPGLIKLILGSFDVLLGMGEVGLCRFKGLLRRGYYALRRVHILYGSEGALGLVHSFLSLSGFRLALMELFFQLVYPFLFLIHTSYLSIQYVDLYILRHDWRFVNKRPTTILLTNYEFT